MKDSTKKVISTISITTLVVALIVLFSGVLIGCNELIGCTKTVYVDVNTGTEVEASENVVKTEDFFNWETIIKDGSVRIVRDKNTDVLYYYEINFALIADGRALTPIMEADGTPLTYTEWKAKRSN